MACDLSRDLAPEVVAHPTRLRLVQAASKFRPGDKVEVNMKSGKTTSRRSSCSVKTCTVVGVSSRGMLKVWVDGWDDSIKEQRIPAFSVRIVGHVPDRPGRRSAASAFSDETRSSVLKHDDDYEWGVGVLHSFRV
jgi:hypothetical protein